jgi:3-dehydrosphinganine reductase
MTPLRGKLALITGGSSGIGLALAKLLASQGCNIAILSRDPNRLSAARDQIIHASTSSNVSVNTIQADVSDFKSLQPVLAQWIGEHSCPDLLINSAGVSRPGLFQDIDLEKFHWMMDINYFGDVHTTRLLLPEMLKRNSGHIVYISSVAGVLGMLGYTAYAPTKFAIKGFADSLRLELKNTGVNLSIVFPPDTETPSLAAERPFQPPVLVAMNENAPPVSPDMVARSIYQGIIKKRYIITPGSDATLFFKLVGLLGGGWLYPLVDLFLADARRKVTRNPSRYSR